MSAYAKLLKAPKLIYKAMRLLLHWIFGDIKWSPPIWITAPWSQIVIFLRWVRREPKKAVLRLSVVLVALGLVTAGTVYWLNRPEPTKPREYSYQVIDPSPTSYLEETKIFPLSIEFDSSVAPLSAVGKTVSSGIEISPKLEGEWRWETGSRLSFMPKSDWPIGETFEVSLSKHGVVAEEFLLDRYDFKFHSLAFSASIIELKFYQDPTNPKLKKVVASIGFSHPVDAADFEKRISMYLGQQKDGKLVEEGKQVVGWSVTYNQQKTEAYLHSDPVPIPPRDQLMLLTVKPGLKTSRGKAIFEGELSRSAIVPGIYSYFRISMADLRVVRNEKDVPEQVLTVETSAGVKAEDLAQKIEAFALPVYHPTEQKEHAGQAPYEWGGPAIIGPEILRVSERVPLTLIPTESEYSNLVSFKHDADTGRFLYVRIKKGLACYGDYVLAESYDSVQRVPQIPRELLIQGEGNILALGGERLISIYSHQIENIKLEVGRVIPEYVNHLVTQTEGTLSQPSFRNSMSFNQDNLTARYTDVRQLKRVPPGTPQYTSFDLSKYLEGPKGAKRRGLFFIRVEEFQPNAKPAKAPARTEEQTENDEGNDQNEEPEASGQESESPDQGEGDQENEADINQEEESGRPYHRTPSTLDSRFILVTDLGILIKDDLGASHDVFITSFSTGEPVAGARVQILGKNGIAIVSANSDAQGHAKLPNVDSFAREQTPSVYIVSKDGDLSFMPYHRQDHMLNLSRFETGGLSNAIQGNQLLAYLFTDRGLYRPGEAVHVGMIVKPANWKMDLSGLPLLAEFTDARGLTIREESIRLSPSGFEEGSYTLEESAPTGDYLVTLYLVKDKRQKERLGSTSFKVQEFLPDRLKIVSRFSSDANGGWLFPEKLQAMVSLRNLFGTPAAGHDVRASIRLDPVSPSFSGYEGFSFTDPMEAKQSFNEQLSDATTDDNGEAVFDLDLKRFDKATYQLSFSAEGSELGGGRSVSAHSKALVSSNQYLLGYKSDSQLHYLLRNSGAKVQMIAISNQLKQMPVSGIRLTLVEQKYLSVLIKQPNGTYSYESKLREIPKKEEALSMPEKGLLYTLPTQQPGNWRLNISTADYPKTVLLSIPFTVVGEANLARSLEKNAELQLLMKKTDFSPGEEIEVQIVAPYTGSGLITIERDKVFAYKWFKAKSNTTIEHIVLPENIEGNAYLSVAFVRDINSSEIYMSPLSYGVKPFFVDLSARTMKLSVGAPEKVKPGESLNISYSSDRPGRMVLFGVDEGILQVAQYKTPNPLGHFFQKRALQVTTWQILSLLMPEVRHLRLASAPGGGDGGDENELLGKNLNPFRRKQQKPVIFWSGILPVDQTQRVFKFQVPDDFNGALRVMAVAVSPDSLAAFSKQTTVKGDFVILPNVPTFVAPGDRFTVSVSVTNNVPGATKESMVKLSLTPSDQLQVVGTSSQDLAICEACERSTTFTVQARPNLGSASLGFEASQGNKRVKLDSTLSVRPPVPYFSVINTGTLQGGSSEQTVTRKLYETFKTQQAGISPLPLILARGLAQYLETLPYECTEQLVSKAFPALILRDKKEFGYTSSKVKKLLSETVDLLRSRQNDNGAFGLYAANAHVSDFASVYAMHFFVEAKERNSTVPEGLMDSGADYLKELAAGEANSPEEIRLHIYAVYLLTRMGQVTTSLTEGLHERLKKESDQKWKMDLVAAYLAATYKLLKMDAIADKLISEVPLLSSGAVDRSDYYDPLVRSAQILYLLARHFPKRLEGVDVKKIEELVGPISRGDYNSLSSAYTILALEAYAGAAKVDNAGAYRLSEITSEGKRIPLPLSNDLFAAAAFSPNAVKIRFEKDGNLPAFTFITEAGFDLTPPAQPYKKGLDVYREYTDTLGQILSECSVGDDVFVHLKIRSTGSGCGNVVAVDLLPGGFDLVLPDRADDSESPSDIPVSSWNPDFVNRREDRVVIYGDADPKIKEFVYQIRAVNAGTFATPPAFAESLYDRSVKAYTPTSGTFTIKPK